MNEFIGKYRKYLHRKSQLVSKNFQSGGFCHDRNALERETVKLIKLG